MTKTIKCGIIINGEIYEVIERTTCTDCSFYHIDGENTSPCPSELCIAFAEKYSYPTCAFGNTDCSCINFCDLFEDLVLKDHEHSYMFQKVEENENK